VRVDALVSRDEQVDVVKAFGADSVYTSAASMPDRSFDLIFDTFSAPVAEKVLDHGRFASIATQAGPVPDLSARGVRSALCQVHADGDGLRELAALVDRGALKLRIDSIFPASQIEDAHRRFREGLLNGKVALTF
jgi:NADPH:quinone reductase-like Zn-dependent oxidoreductase